MGPPAATLLCYFEPERVYAALTRLHDAYSMHMIFSPGFPGLLEAIYVQERIMQLKMPDVYAAFKKHMVSTTAYATKWYIALFANSVPFQTQLRLWDAFLLEGQDIFVAVAVAIIWTYRGEAIQSIIRTFTSQIVERSHHIKLSQLRDHSLLAVLRVRPRKGRRASFVDPTSTR